MRKRKLRSDIRINRLQKLHDFLLTLDDSKFWFGDYISEIDNEEKCGTVCCAIGWLPAVDKRNWEWAFDGWEEGYAKFQGQSDFAAALSYFGISYDLCSHLFLPVGQFNRIDPNSIGLQGTSTPKQVASNMLNVITKLKNNELNDHLS